MKICVNKYMFLILFKDKTHLEKHKNSGEYLKSAVYGGYLSYSD
jgi:hypothetical protein